MWWVETSSCLYQVWNQYLLIESVEYVSVMTPPPPPPPSPPFPSSIWFSYQIQQTEQKIDISVTRQNVATES